ncbi:MAG: hypothetical protein MZV65_13485 [Chromatiales bacterium]|nr:hypothetical protein [Chromatiales bacterium]
MTVMNSPVVTETVPVVANRDGVLCIGQTRVTLDTLIQALPGGRDRRGNRPAIPHECRLADIYSVIGYYLPRRRPEMEAYLARRRQAAEQVRQPERSTFSTRWVSGPDCWRGAPGNRLSHAAVCRRRKLQQRHRSGVCYAPRSGAGYRADSG